MKFLLLVLLILSITLVGFNQEKNFDLNKYKFPDYKRHLMEFTGNSMGSKDIRSTDNVNMDSIVKMDYLNSKNESHFDLNYEYDYLTRKRIYNLTSAFKGNYNYSMQKFGDEKTTESNPGMQWNLKGFSRYYLIENKLFMEGSTAVNHRYSKEKKTTTYGNSDDYFRAGHWDVSIGLGVGSGRMEKVNDLWQAYYILEKLNKQNSLSRQWEEKDVFEFATLVSKLKNKRILDFRTRRINELKGLDSLLHQQGLINERDISYFTTLNDYWSYGSFQSRESGRVLKLWVTPNYEYNVQKINNQKEVSEYFTSLVAYASLDCNKQLNLLWERRFKAIVSYREMIDVPINTHRVFPNTDIHTNASVGYGFFPNSRTVINGDLGYMGRNIYSNSHDKWGSQVTLSLNGNFYVSPHLQFSAGCSASYGIKTYSNYDETYISYGLGLTYKIF